MATTKAYEIGDFGVSLVVASDGTVQSLDLNTSQVDEGSNLYYTNARARAAVSVSGSLSYDSNTGVVSYTTPSTIASISNHDTDDLTEGTGNLYFTSARARASLTGGAGITYSSSTGNIALTASGVTVGSYGSASQVPQITVDAYGRITSLSTTSVAGVTDFDYNTSTGVLDIDTADGGNFTATVTLAPFDTGDLTEGTNLYYTDTRARAAVSATGSLSYNSTTGVFSFTQGNTDTVAEGSTNLYYTDARARSAISATGSLSYNSTTGVMSFTQGNTDTVAEGSTNLYYTDARARAALSASDGITYNSSTGAFTLTDTGVTAGSYGSASAVPVITVNANGQITALSTTAVAGVSSFSFNGTSEILTINTADGGSFTADISSMASQSYVDTAISNLVDSSPATLNTLNELAAALGDDPNFATTVATSIGTKLDSSSYTASDVLTKIKTVDGSGSGLDADTLDGLNSTRYIYGSDDLGARSTTTFAENPSRMSFHNINNASAELPSSTGGGYWQGLDFRHYNLSSTWGWQLTGTYNTDNSSLYHRQITSGTRSSWYKIWDNNNDGAGSGLDADLLDGLQASQFLRSDTDDTTTGDLTISKASAQLILNKGDTSNYAGIQLKDNTASRGYLGIAGTSGNYSTGAVQHDLVLRSESRLLFATGGASTRVTIDSSGNVGIGTDSPAQKLDVNGNIRHQGLTMTSGTDIDQITTITVSMQVTTAWQNIPNINGNVLPRGTYIIQMYADNYNVGGQLYRETYSGTMTWFGYDVTNSPQADEIVLHAAGHAENNGRLYLRTQRTYVSDGKLYLQIRSNAGTTAADDYTFKFRRMI